MCGSNILPVKTLPLRFSDYQGTTPQLFGRRFRYSLLLVLFHRSVELSPPHPRPPEQPEHEGVDGGGGANR